MVSSLLVLPAGLASVTPGVGFAEALAMVFGLFVYGFLANVCSTLGWIVDTMSHRGKPGMRCYFFHLCHFFAGRVGCCRLAYDCYHSLQT